MAAAVDTTGPAKSGIAQGGRAAPRPVGGARAIDRRPHAIVQAREMAQRRVRLLDETQRQPAGQPLRLGEVVARGLADGCWPGGRRDRSRACAGPGGSAARARTTTAPADPDPRAGRAGARSRPGRAASAGASASDRRSGRDRCAALRAPPRSPCRPRSGAVAGASAPRRAAGSRPGTSGSIRFADVRR